MIRIFVGIICCIVLGTVVFMNCGDAPVSRPDSLQIESTGLGKIRPVLAVRSPACLMCHAKIYGNVVVDFGYGDPFFFALDKKENHIKDVNYGPFMSKHALDGGSWESASIFGDIYVPKVNLTDGRVLKAYSDPKTGNPTVAELPLFKFMTSQYVDPLDNSLRYFIKPETSRDEVIPGLRGKVIPRKSVYISAPTEEEIKSLVFRPGAVQKLAVLGALIYTGSSKDTITGIIAKQHSISKRYYVTNKTTVHCSGDVIIDGVLFLNNLSIKSDERGCRLYVSRSVFIQGPITFVDSHRDATIQISSARAIVMGTRSLSTRFSEDATVLMTQGMRGAITDEQELAFNMKIFDDRDHLDGLVNDAGPYKTRRLVNRNTTPPSLGDVIAVMDDFDDRQFRYLPGQPEIPGDQCQWSLQAALNANVSCVEAWAEGYKRKSVSYKNILLNAPKVHSRYWGDLRGIVIAEEALFAVNQFRFSYAPVFNRVPVLPLIGDRILSVSEE